MTKENEVDLVETTVADAVAKGLVQVGSEIQVTAVVSSLYEDDEFEDSLIQARIDGKGTWTLDGVLPIKIVQKWHTVKSMQEVAEILNKLPTSTKVAVKELEDRSNGHGPRSVLEINWINLLDHFGQITFKVCN